MSRPVPTRALNVAEVEILETDVLVVGGGIAGHRAAIAAHDAGASVLMVYLARGASPYVIGCNAPIGHADSRDNPAAYFEDMVRGGYGLNDRRLVEALCRNMGEAYWELAQLGVPFAAEGARVRQRRLSGNSFPRSVFVPEGVGLAILNSLAGRVRALGIRLLAGWKAVTLLEDDGEVVGALAWRRHGDRLACIRARSVVLASGGIGRLYDDSTYPADVLSNSYGLGLRAGARLVDMEFVQFEPVVTVWPPECRGMEMPTAMLAEGAQLINGRGDRFMMRHNPGPAEVGIEKARLALFIQSEIDAGAGLPDGSVVFDTTHVPHELLEGYVSHCRRLRSAGLEPRDRGPHVRPAAHSQMGGLFIDADGWTGVPGLYAGGEAAGGVHGASRIAGNGCSDTVVFGALAGKGAAAGMLGIGGRDWPRILADALRPFEARMGGSRGRPSSELKDDLRRIMVRHVGLWRDRAGLEAGIAQIRAIMDGLDRSGGAGSWGEALASFEAREVASVALVIATAALLRTESRGAHQRRDHPAQDDTNWLRHIGFARDGAGDITAGDITAEDIPIH
ncbi:FAD-binding protein [Xanthobacter dioxanivorans]|uniref:FAD-binding protein n=1 Tax=Xanthobacter dioxanivorans TaxID=2528964 RepID=A0A974PSV7_9HYPH|nr:FAD-binding protein [Xanthobacter dioxanivorans]